MTTETWRPVYGSYDPGETVPFRFAKMTADHYREAEEWQRGQVLAVAHLVQEIIDIVGFQPGPPYTGPIFHSVYDATRLLDHIRAIVARTEA